jgi:hypothetical protein
MPIASGWRSRQESRSATTFLLMAMLIVELAHQELFEPAPAGS